MLATACAENLCLNDGVKEGETAICFDSEQARQTRATGTEAATALGMKFTVYGEKTRPDGTVEVVFPSYEVQYLPYLANNVSGWMYEGIGDQLLKYWEYKSSYRFFAYSLGKGDESTTPATYATGSTMDDEGYTLTGTPAQLSACYISDRLTPDPTASTTVTIEFKRFSARVRLGLYETIPGYAVKDVRFYTGESDTESDGNGCLFAGDANEIFASEGTYQVRFDGDGKAVASLQSATQQQSFVTFGTMNYTIPDDNQLTGSKESDRIYLSKISSAPTYAGSGAGYYLYVLPTQGNTHPLQMKLDYTLLSNDGSGQQITVKGATATIPVQYSQWRSNYSYTYLFRISDNTNGQTGQTSPEGLYPITFVAYGEEIGTDNNQIGTVTTFSDWSITALQNNAIVNGGVVYYMGKQTKLSVIKGNGSQSEQVKLQAPANQTDWVVIYHQVTGNEWEVEETTTDDTTPKEGLYLETVDEYDSEGNAWFKPDMKGTYRIEYWHKEGGTAAEKRAVKVIRVEEKTGFTIQFNLHGQGDPIADLDGMMKLPDPLPTPTGNGANWYFQGWFLDEEYTQPATPDADITSDVTLHAKWQRVFTGEDLEEEM